MMTDERRQWLRGAYLDRITECAMHFAATRTYFIDSDFVAFIAGEFDYLRDLSDEDRQYLRDQVGLESLRRVALARAEDREQFFGKLIADNDDVVASDAEFSFDIGWLDLVRDAVARMRTYPASWRVRLDGGKEKFGCCVLFVSFDVDARGAMYEIRRMREEIRLRSLATCDICGETGRLRIGSWAKTTCDKHAAVLGEFRADDGKWADPWRWLEDDKDEYSPESLEVLKGLEPVRPRPKYHSIVDWPKTDVVLQIEADIEKNYGRKADLLLEFVGQIEIAVLAAMSVADSDVDTWLRSEVDTWEGVEPLSDADREFLHLYLRNLAIDERVRRQRREDGMEALRRFLGEVGLQDEADQLKGRERELLEAYAGDLADSAIGSVVKAEFLDGYVRDELYLWPNVLELSDDDREWLRKWLRTMIDAEYDRIKNKQ